MKAQEADISVRIAVAMVMEPKVNADSLRRYEHVKALYL